MGSITIRLDDEATAALKRLKARSSGSQSAIVRDAILRADAEHARASDYASLIEPLLGSIEGAPPDLSENVGRSFAKAMARKYAAR